MKRVNATCTAESVAWRLCVRGTVNSVQAYCRFAIAIIATIPAPSCHQRPTRKPPRAGASPVIEALSAAASHERAAAAPPIVHDNASLDCQKVADTAGTLLRRPSNSSVSCELGEGFSFRRWLALAHLGEPSLRPHQRPHHLDFASRRTLPSGSFDPRQRPGADAVSPVPRGGPHRT